MKFITKFKKVVSLIVTTSLVISFVIQPQTINAMTNEEATKQYKQIFKDFVLPYSYGQITKAHYAGTDRVVINIQDLHCHPKVQRNISNIIETFDKSYGVNKVYLEGAYGKVDTSWINKKIQEYSMPELLDKMLETGRLTGAEYYSALSGKNQIINGLEEKGPYLENLKRFGTIVENQEKINMILNAMDESLASLKKKYYTKRQYKIEELSKNFSEGKISPQKYYSLLSKHIDKLGIDISKYENTFTYVMLLELQKKLDYSKITTELQTLLLLLKEQFPQAAYQMLLDNTDNFRKIDKLYSYIVQISRLYSLDLAVNFPNLDKYFGYIEFSQKINPLDLIVEEENLTREINTRFSETKAQREIVFLVNFRKYLKDYVTSKITSSDYDYYMKNIDTYKQLWNKYVDNRVLSLLDDYMAEADKFYKINNDRNIYFTNNMFKESDVLNKIESETEAKGDVNKIIENMKSVKEIDVVITGGFHSQTVTEILKNHGVSYIVITPNVEDGVKLAEDTYYQIAKEQSKISFQALANLIASLSPVVQQKIFETIDAKEKIQDISELSSEEKMKKLREIISAKLLESDDKGEVIDKIVDIINENVGTHITEEFLDKIGVENFKDLLNGDIKDLKKVVETLQQPVLEQAITAISDSVDAVQEQISNIEQISQNDQEEQISGRTQDKNVRTRFVTGVKKAAACVILSLTLMFSPLNLFGTDNVQAAGSDIAPVKNESVKKKEEISFEYLTNTVDSKYVSQTEEDFDESVAFSDREDVLQSIQELKALLNKSGFSIDDDTRIIFMKGTAADLNTACAFPEIKTIVIPVDELSTDNIDSLINLLSGKVTKDMDLDLTLAFMQQIVHENTHVNNKGKDLSPLKDEELAIYSEITTVDKLIKAGILDIKTLKEHGVEISFPDMRLNTGELVNHVAAMKYIGIKGAVDNSEDIVNSFRNITGNPKITFYDMNYVATLYSDKNSLGFEGENLVDSGLDLTEMEIVIALNGTRNGPVVRFVVDTNINVDEGPIKGSINKGTGNFILNTSDFRFIEESKSESARVQQQSGQEIVGEQMTTIPTKFILKVLRIDEMSDKGQRVINLLENWQILLGIFFPAVRKMFVNLHGKQNKKEVEQGLEYIEKTIRKTLELAIDETFEQIPTLTFIKRLQSAIIVLQNPEIKKDLDAAHTAWNIPELRGTIKNIDKEQAIQDANLDEDFIQLVKQKSRFWNILDFLKEKRDYRKSKKDSYEQFLRSEGVALGLASYEVLDEKLVRPVDAAIKLTNMSGYTEALRNIVGIGGGGSYVMDYMPELFKYCKDHGKKIYFFLPNDAKAPSQNKQQKIDKQNKEDDDALQNISNDETSRTKKEIEWMIAASTDKTIEELRKLSIFSKYSSDEEILSAVADMKKVFDINNVEFIVGAYDFLNIENDEIYEKHFNGDKFVETLSTILLSPEQFMVKDKSKESSAEVGQQAQETISLVNPTNLDESVRKSGIVQVIESVTGEAFENQKNNFQFKTFEDAVKEINSKRKGLKWLWLRTKQKIAPKNFIENSFGFSLGLTSYMEKRTYNILPIYYALSEFLNLCTWGQYEQASKERVVNTEKHIPALFNDCRGTDKKIYMFVPPELFSMSIEDIEKMNDYNFRENEELSQFEKTAGATFDEIKGIVSWLKDHPEDAKYVEFVFGAYDYLNVPDEQFYNEHFKNLSELYRKIFDGEIELSQPVSNYKDREKNNLIEDIISEIRRLTPVGYNMGFGIVADTLKKENIEDLSILLKFLKEKANVNKNEKDIYGDIEMLLSKVVKNPRLIEKNEKLFGKIPQDIKEELSAMHIISLERYFEVVKNLADKGINVNIKDIHNDLYYFVKKGMIPSIATNMFEAYYNGDMKIIDKAKMLMKYFANSLPDSFVLWFGDENFNFAKEEKLVNRVYEIGTELDRFIKKRNIKIEDDFYFSRNIGGVLQDGFSANQTDKYIVECVEKYLTGEIDSLIKLHEIIKEKQKNSQQKETKFQLEFEESISEIEPSVKQDVSLQKNKEDALRTDREIKDKFFSQNEIEKIFNQLVKYVNNSDDDILKFIDILERIEISDLFVDYDNLSVLQQKNMMNEIKSDIDNLFMNFKSRSDREKLFKILMRLVIDGYIDENDHDYLLKESYSKKQEKQKMKYEKTKYGKAIAFFGRINGLAMYNKYKEEKNISDNIIKIDDVHYITLDSFIHIFEGHGYGTNSEGDKEETFLYRTKDEKPYDYVIKLEDIDKIKGILSSPDFIKFPKNKTAAGEHKTVEYLKKIGDIYYSCIIEDTGRVKTFYKVSPTKFNETINDYERINHDYKVEQRKDSKDRYNVEYNGITKEVPYVGIHKEINGYRLKIEGNGLYINGIKIATYNLGNWSFIKRKQIDNESVSLEEGEILKILDDRKKIDLELKIGANLLLVKDNIAKQVFVIDINYLSEKKDFQILNKDFYKAKVIYRNNFRHFYIDDDNSFSYNEGKVIDVDSSEELSETKSSIEYDDLVPDMSFSEMLLEGINPIKAILNLIGEFFYNQEQLEGKVIMVQEGQQVKVPENVTKIEFKINKDIDTETRGGKIIGVINGKTIRANKKGNSITFYSKQGLEGITQEEIESLFIEAISSGIKEDLVKEGTIVAFAQRTDTTISDIQNRIEIARKYGIIKADTEIKFDLTNEKNINVETCNGEYKSTGANTFVITQDQTESKDISALREKGYRFIVSCKADTISNIMLLDGIQVDAKDLTSKQQAISLLEKLQKMCNVEKTISVEFNESLYKELKGMDIFKMYGVLPLVKADSIGFVTGKKEVKEITDKTNIEKILTDDEIVGVIADSESRNIFSVIKDMLKIKTNVYDKGLNVGLREGHACDISKLKNVLVKGEVKLEDISSLGLQTEDKVYLEYLLENEKSEEAIGFVIGIAMKNIKQQWETKFTNIDDNLFTKEGKGQYEKGLLLLMLSMQMSGIEIKDLLEEVSVAQYDDRGWNLSAEEMYRIIGEKASVIITRVLNENDKKIKVLSEDEIVKSKEDFKDLNILIQDRFRVQESAQEVKISALAVKSILAAA